MRYHCLVGRCCCPLRGRWWLRWGVVGTQMHVSSPEDAPWGEGAAKDRSWQLLLVRVFARLG